MTSALLSRDTTGELAAFWLALDPADALARFAAAVRLLALVNEELAAAQELVNHSVERAVAEARGAR